MILDQLRNASLYFGMGERLRTAFTYLLNTDLTALTPGKYEVSGTDIYALAQEYQSKPVEQGFWEAHRQYIDIQYVVSGMERMGYATLDQLTAGPYDAEKDFIKLTGNGQFVTVGAGAFTVFTPQDAHMPGLLLDSPQLVKKVVMKVRV